MISLSFMLALLAIMACLYPPLASAGSAHIPQPWRADAVVQGRDEAYDTERFVHELTFDHHSPAPSPLQNGMRGTGGSVGSDELYYDFRFRQDFGFREGHNGFLLDIQRSEDLDGAYDRQLVGFRQMVGQHSELWLQGDVFSDKAQSDIYLSARHYLGPGSWLHASWILPDAYFNDKTASPDEFSKEPQTAFLQWHQQHGPQQLTLSVNWSPESEFISRQQALTVTSDSVRGALTYRRESTRWQLAVDLEAERSRRSYLLQGPDETGRPDFSRDSARATTSARFLLHRLKPRLGLAYIHLDERGFFGRALNSIGTIKRREPVLFGDITLQASARTTIQPGLYLAAPDIRQAFRDTPPDNHNGFVGKLALPVTIRVSANDQARLTLNPTFYLHKAAFGGGNLQFHWPM
ncbi:hypothetical protein [Marinobacter sp. VGCF2001]|uniref:hypothetical protein n=1 Tax=Marinobacter sp. VGCF2001 TaxID=3417189 RepID=UPI003CF2CFFA